jgi:hypothetical protein
MSNENKDGGPAFPFGMDGDTYCFSTVGMSLRDYFAGQDLAGLMANPRCTIKYNGQEIGSASEENGGEKDNDFGNTTAKDCYAMADAMLKAREEKR